MRRLRDATRILIVTTLYTGMLYTGVTCSTMFAFAQTQPGETAGGRVHLELLQGSGDNELPDGSIQRIQVQLLDASNRPVQGATVLFRAPDSVPTVRFPGNSSTATASTDFNGYATAPPETPAGEGGFEVRASAPVRGDVANLVIPQRNVNPARREAPQPTQPLTRSVPALPPSQPAPVTAPPDSAARVRLGLPPCDPATTPPGLRVDALRNVSGRADASGGFSVGVWVSSSCQPVGGASVTFTLPTSGPGGVFESGGTAAVVRTGDDGVARSPEIRRNAEPGQWEIMAKALAGDVSAERRMPQRNTEAARTATAPEHNQE